MDLKIVILFSLLALALAVPQNGGPKGPKNPKDGEGPFQPKGPKGPKDGSEGGGKGKGGEGGFGGKGGEGGNGGGQGKGGMGPQDPEEPADPVEPPSEMPTVPTACSDANQGRCECGDTSDGFYTYTFWLGDVQRCFTVYHPTSRASEALPVVLSPNCYGQDSLQGNEMKVTFSDWNQGAERYGFARIGLSTPDGHWTFGNDGVVNDENPMPCSDEESKDMPYLKAVFDFIDANPDQFDGSRIWAQGFSQNSMFSAYIGFCFNQRVLGVWQGGSGMALTGQLPNLPGCQGQVTASDFASCDAAGTKCNQCIEDSPCTECQYWPIYPCYTPARPMVDCLAEYVNDFISVSPENGEDSSALYMYERLLNEGHDARLMRFSPSDDGTVPGNHQDPQNKVYWTVGCLGMTESCSQDCEDSFLTCLEGQNPSTAKERTEAFAECMDTNNFNGLAGCEETCSPTFGMLSASEMPTTVEFANWGAGPETAQAQPAASMCVADSN